MAILLAADKRDYILSEDESEQISCIKAVRLKMLMVTRYFSFYAFFSEFCLRFRRQNKIYILSRLRYSSILAQTQPMDDAHDLSTEKRAGTLLSLSVRRTASTI